MARTAPSARLCTPWATVLWTCCCTSLVERALSSASFFKLASADSLTQVRRDWLPQQQAACSAGGMKIDMAQNEFEGAQLVVFVPNDSHDSVYNLTWSISELVDVATGATIPSADVTVAPLGFVFGGPCPFDSHNPACPASAPWYCKYGNDHNDSDPGPDTCMARLQTLRCVGCAASPAHPLRQNTMPYNDSLGWWPYPVLDWVDSFDVARGTAQPLMVTVHSRADTKPGTYTATINVTEYGACRADGGCGRPESMPLSVTVHKVAIPEVHSPETLSFWGVEISEWADAHPGRPCNDSKFTDLLLDHRVPSGSGIYHGMWGSYAGDSGGGASHPDHYIDGLKNLWERGQRAIVLEGLTDCQGGLNKTGCELDYRISQVKALAARATAQGWSEENLFVYIFDEVGPSSVNAVGRILSSRIKAVCANCQVVACGSAVFHMLAADPTVYEKGQGGALELVDVFIPRLADYANASKTLLATLRAAGKKVGWYVSGAPARPHHGLTAIKPELAFIMSNLAGLTDDSPLILDPYAGTGSLLLPAAHLSCYPCGADIELGATDVVIGSKQGGRGAGAPGSGVVANFRHLGLTPPELIQGDIFSPAWASQRAGVFDAIVADPPYGLRTFRQVDKTEDAGGQSQHAQRAETSLRYLCDFTGDQMLAMVKKMVTPLLQLAVRVLKTGGRLVYIFPTFSSQAGTVYWDEESFGGAVQLKASDVPVMKGLRFESSSHEPCVSRTIARNVVVMVKDDVEE